MLSTPAAIEWISSSLGIDASAPGCGFQHTAISASCAAGSGQDAKLTPGSSRRSGSSSGAISPGVLRNAILIMR